MERTSQPVFVYDLVCIQSPTTYTDLIEYDFVGDPNAPLLLRFPIIFNLKSGDLMTTGQWMSYQTFSNLKFKPLPITFFHNLHIDSRDIIGEKIPFYVWVLQDLF